jgi:Kef-type K+ transport system membrane component KefB
VTGTRLIATWRGNLAQPFATLLLQVIVILALARLCRSVARRAGQPPVLGEMAAGIVLGPSLVGTYFPAFFESVFPADSLGPLQLLSQIGVVLFIFVVSLEFDWQQVRHQARAAVAVSNVSILLPFLLGVLAALPLYAADPPAGISFRAFALFMGIAMSITAFPVLARILEDRHLIGTPLGAMALTCAAVDDVTAWTLLAFVVAVVTSGGAFTVLAATLGLVVLFVIIMIFIVRPALQAWTVSRGPREDFSSGDLALPLGVLLVSALATETIGIHALFGAFVAGAVMADTPRYRLGLRERLERVSSVLLPLFFATNGLRVRVGLLNDLSGWLMFGGLVALATVGKLGGSTVTARIMGMDWNTAFTLGALLNTRGLMELIALNVGYELGVISPRVFTALVLMALTTTAMTGPLVDFFGAKQAAAERYRASSLPGGCN